MSRTIAAAVEQHYDEKGLVWPKAMAPYHASLVIVNVKDEEQMDAGEVLYNRLQEAGFDILMDDRKERAGVKFNDAISSVCQCASLWARRSVKASLNTSCARLTRCLS